MSYIIRMFLCRIVTASTSIHILNIHKNNVIRPSTNFEDEKMSNKNLKYKLMGTSIVTTNTVTFLKLLNVANYT